MSSLTGHFTINGTDVYNTLGAYLLRGGEWDLLAIPTRKPPVTTQWAEHSLVDVDLTNPVYEPKKIKLGIGINADSRDALKAKEAALFALLTTQPATIYVRSLDVTVTARYEGATPRYFANKAVELQVQLVMDEPLQWMSSSASPTGAFVQPVGNMINGLDVSTYGVTLTRDSNFGIWPTMVEPIKQTNARTTGQTVDTGKTPTFNPGEIKLSCVMVADSLAHLKANLLAFKGQLNADDYRLIYIRSLNKTLWTSYKSMDVKYAKMRGQFILAFELTMTCYFTAMGQQPETNDYRDDQYLINQYN